MKSLKLLLASGVLLASVITPQFVQAKDVKSLGFTLPMYQGVNYTPQSLKGATGGYSVMNITDISGGGSYALDGYLVNTSNLQRGNYASGLGETRNVIANWSSAQKGYYYKFRCMNHSSISSNAVVYGSWAADNQ